MKKYAKVVFLDSKELNSLPPKVKQAINAAGGSMPLVVFLSPNEETNFGAFSHQTLKNQKYSTIFKEVKKKIKAAQEDGSLKDSGLVAEVADAENKDVDSDSVVIASPRVRTWKSAKGSEIKAKLIKFEGDTYHLKTTKGKTIKVTAADLDAASVKMAEEIVSINKK
ncbi:MAG: hypothetical protein ACI9E1_001262 [Cryomorphaceae bacterium]|jgi:hypothetical protein